jgi:Domain of unknown function (DUF6456)
MITRLVFTFLHEWLHGKEDLRGTNYEQARGYVVKQILAERSIRGDQTAPNGKPSRSVTVNLAESPLAWLGARKLVSQRQLMAGEMLRQDYERAALPQSTTMQWNAPPNAKVARGSHSHGALTLAQIDAKKRFDGAITAAGAGLADILWRVVCAGEAVPTAEKALGWPTRSGRLVLLLALDRVADYYRVN